MVNSDDIDELWLRMAKMYGHKWLTNFGAIDDGTWLRGLSELAPAQLAIGLERCLKRKDPWPPSLPEFRALCLPTEKDLGIPSLDQAYKMATLNGNAANLPSIVLNAKRITGEWELRTMARERIFPKFKRIYETLTDEMLENAATEERQHYLTGGKDGRLYITHK